MKYFYLFILAIICIAVWQNSVNVPFQFDDEHVIVTNSDLQNPAAFTFAQKWFSFHGRPLSNFSFMLNYQLHQTGTTGYHLVNILIHFAATVAVYFIILLLLSFAGGGDEGRKRFIAMAGAAIFLVHPMQAESVTYISQRMTSLAGMFFLWAYFCYLMFRSHEKKRILNAVLFVLFIILSFFSKQTALNIFPVILVTEIIMFRESHSKTRNLIILAALIATAAIAAMVWYSGIETRDSLLLSRRDFLISQFPVLISYLSKVLVPVQLNVDYDVPVYSSLLNIVPLLSFVGIILILAGAWFIRKVNKLAALGIFFFFAALSLESSVFPIKDLMADHRVYTGMAGFAIVISSVMFTFKNYKAVYIIILIPLFAFSFLTINRNTVWQSEISLWQDAVLKSPEKSRAWNNLGFSYLKLDKLNEATPCFEKSLAINPEDYAAWNNLGVTAYRQKKYFLAVKSFYRSIVINRAYFPALNNMGKALVDLKLYYQALYVFNHILKKYPCPTDVLYNKAVCLEGINRPDMAKDIYLSVIQTNPDYVDAAFNLGVIYMNELNDSEAEKYFRYVLKYEKDDTDAMNNIACIYYRNGRTEEAKTIYKNILKIVPNNKTALNNLKNIQLEI